MATCLEGLDLFALQLVNIACLLPDGASRAEWMALAGPDIDHDDVGVTIGRLRSVALIWGDDDELRLVDIVRQQIPHPDRLGRPVATLAIGLQRPGLDGIATALGLSKVGNKQTVLGRVATALADPELVRARVTTASRGARRILEEADQVGPTCHVPPGYWWHGGIRPRNDLDWLLAHGLLMLTDWSSAEVPREVGLALRAATPTPACAPVLRRSRSGRSIPPPSTRRQPPRPTLRCETSPECSRNWPTPRPGPSRPAASALELFSAQDWGLIVYDEVHLLPAPVFRMTADIQSRRRLGLTAILVREDGREGDVFSLIGPKRYDAPWRDIEAQGWMPPAICTEVRVTLSALERMTYAVAEPEERYRVGATAASKLRRLPPG